MKMTVFRAVKELEKLRKAAGRENKKYSKWDIQTLNDLMTHGKPMPKRFKW